MISRHPPALRRLTARSFWRRFGRLEHERLEFKRSAQHLQESIVAMATASGGVIVVGVTDDRRLLGCAHEQVTFDRIAMIAHETQVDVTTRALLVGRTPLIAVYVPPVPDRIVTTADGRMLRRLGGVNQPLRGDAVARVLGARIHGAEA
jgi:predicted HTH transcriptional regulator